MELLLSTEHEAKLADVVMRTGRPATELITEAVSHYLDEQQRLLDFVQVGLDEADRGELISHEEVLARFAHYLQPSGER